MGLGQTMITAAFLVLLTIAVMNANKMIIDKSENYYRQEAVKEAGYLAGSLLSEISTRAYHQGIDTATYAGMHPTSAFDPTYFGPGPSISYVNPVGKPDSVFPFKSMQGYYDDIDDYNGYLRNPDTVSTLKGFRLITSVYYINNSFQPQPPTSPTYLKKIDVKVINSNYLFKYLPNGTTVPETLTFSTVIAY